MVVLRLEKKDSLKVCFETVIIETCMPYVVTLLKSFQTNISKQRKLLTDINSFSASVICR